MIILGYYIHHSKRSLLINWETLKIFLKKSKLIENKSKKITLTWVSFKLPCLLKKSVKHNWSNLFTMLILMVRGTFTLQTIFNLHSCSICSYNFFIHVLKTCKKITRRFHRYVVHRLELQVPTLISKIWTRIKFEY